MHIFSGLLKNRPLKTPKGAETRPTMGIVREALFNICQNYIEGSYFLDLFAGSGAMGIEGLSRGATHATFIDASRDSIRCIHENLEIFQLEDKAQVLQGDVWVKLQLLERLGKKFNIIYSDPPYDNSQEGLAFSNSLLEKVDKGALLLPGGRLFIEGPHPFRLSAENLKKLLFERERRLGRVTLQQYRMAED